LPDTFPEDFIPVSGSRTFLFARQPGMIPTAIPKKCTLVIKPGEVESIIGNRHRVELNQFEACGGACCSINCSAPYYFYSRPKDGETYFAACASVGIWDGSPLAAFNSNFPTSFMKKTVLFVVSETRAISCSP
jgi:hypothetical protein